MANRSLAAGRVSVSSGRSGWCGSCTLAGYDTLGGVTGAWVLSNAHVLPKVGQRATFRFQMPDGSRKDFPGVAKYVAYSERFQIDWAFAFIPGLTEGSGISPVKLSKARPVGRKFQQTGSPRCVWPLTSFDCTIRDVIQSQRVYRWLPNSIGGQSGSSLRSNSNRGVAEILLTWSYSPGYGAGQATYHVWISQKTKSSEVGFLRIPGLVEVAGEDETPIGDRGLQPGYFEEPQEMGSVQELPVWDGDIDPGDDPGQPDVDPPATPTKGVPVDVMIDYLEAQNEVNGKMLKTLEGLPADGESTIKPDPDTDGGGLIHGL